MTRGLGYLAGILALTFGVPLSLQPVFAQADQSIVVPYTEEAS